MGLSLEQFLQENEKKGITKFQLKNTGLGKDHPRIIIHPDGKDGKTLDYDVKGNKLCRIVPEPVKEKDGKK